MSLLLLLVPVHGESGERTPTVRVKHGEDFVMHGTDFVVIDG